jgi:hypothetical protein
VPQQVGTFVFLAGPIACLLGLLGSGASWLLRSEKPVWSAALESWTWPVAVVAAAGIALSMLGRPWFRFRALRRKARSDLANGLVDERHYTFVEAKRFQEPEHGGLIYCLRTSDDKVLVLYDAESQDLGVAGKNPLTSSFAVASELRLVRAPQSGLTLTKHFSGTPLSVSTPVEIRLPPGKWPEDEDLWDVGWDELERKLAMR